MTLPMVVLVHGAWHGPWCWEEIAPLLDAAGVPHLEVDLPFTGHDDDIAAVRTALDGCDGAKVLVGHSYGGLVISGAGAGRSDLSHLVYMCAFMPPRGDSLVDVLGRARFLPHLKVLDAIQTEDGGASSIKPDHAVGVFYGRCAPEVSARAIARLRPMVGSSIFSRSRGAPWRSVQSTYVLCLRDEAIPLEGQRLMATQATHTVAMDADHSPFLSMPEETARILTTIAGDA